MIARSERLLFLPTWFFCCLFLPIQSLPRFGGLQLLAALRVERLRCYAAQPRKEGHTVATLTSLQGNGGGRIPMGSFSYDVSRHELAAIIAAMPTATCRAMHHATREGDLTTAQHLLREAAERYLTSTPAAPAVQPPAPRSGARRSGRTQTNERS